MGKLSRATFVLAFVLTACAVSGQDNTAGSPAGESVKPPVAQPVPASDAGYKNIQEISVPKEYIVMPGMKVSGDGSLVLYVVQIAGDALEYAVMANKTRLADRLLEMAKTQREKTGDTNISLDAADYRYTMVGDLVPSPLWQAVVYGVATAKYGPMVLVNSLKPPDYASLWVGAGAYPSWYAGTTGEMIAYFAAKDNKIKLIADEEIALDDGALPVASAIIRGKRKAYVVSTANRCSLYLDGKKVSEDYDAIEPAFFYKGTATDSTIAYIAKKGDKSTLVVDGKVQETEFVPAHDLVYAPGGDPFMYAAVSGGREFVVRNGVRVTKDKDFAQVRWLTFDRTKAKIAYVARDGTREWVMINDRKVTPEYELVTFCREQFRINGELLFAGLDGAKNSIVAGKVETPADKAPADKAKNDIPVAGWTVLPLGGPYPWVIDVSGGQEVVTARVGALHHAQLRSGTAASWVDLNPKGSPESYAHGVSGGQQVGEAYFSGKWHAGLWSGTAASWVDLNPKRAAWSRAYGVSGGKQVGDAEFGYRTHAGLWSGTAASWVDLNPAGADRSSAYGVSGGQQVGDAEVNGIAHASLWSGTAASWVDLHPAGSPVSQAFGVSGGQQVGSAKVGDWHASLWSGTAESWVDLHPAGATKSYARGVSGGQQVGYAFVDGKTHAGIWSGTAQSWVDLHALLPAGVYSSSEAKSIDVSGDEIWVAGHATNTSTGYAEAMLWHYTAEAKTDIPLYDGKPGAKIGDVCVNPKDGAEMVWVPAGEFTMGSTDEQIAVALKEYKGPDVLGFFEAAKFACDAEKPQHKVYLDGYWMYKCEVTVAQYRKFCEATKTEMPEAPPWGWKEDHPMVNVNWQDTTDYAKWAGVSLPTEAQWEKAARGTDGRIHPWGNEWAASKCANSVGMETESTKAVGIYASGASPYGCMDMAGNAHEWCADWYDPNYYKNAPTKNPTGPSKEVEFKTTAEGDVVTGARVLRGGSWSFIKDVYFRCARRNSSDPTKRYSYYGFRCARTP